MADLSKRGSKKYTEIKKYQPYELTHFIYYTMSKFIGLKFIDICILLTTSFW